MFSKIQFFKPSLQKNNKDEVEVPTFFNRFTFNIIRL